MKYRRMWSCPKCKETPIYDDEENLFYCGCTRLTMYISSATLRMNFMPMEG